jgi:hypothetical protein
MWQVSRPLSEMYICQERDWAFDMPLLEELKFSPILMFLVLFIASFTFKLIAISQTTRKGIEMKLVAKDTYRRDLSLFASNGHLCLESIMHDKRVFDIGGLG